jgi:hypothetical protein
MNVTVLIDSVVRQTTILIAQLATSVGTRAPLAHIANQVFVDLTKELRQQGLGQKVIADMFGLALRTYHDKVRRLSESRSFVGRSLWDAVHEFLSAEQAVSRADVMRRFHNDDPAMVSAVLRDLVDSGIVFATGRGDHMTYRLAMPNELALSSAEDAREGLVNLVWIALYRRGPSSASELAQSIPLEPALVRDALEELSRDGRARRAETSPEPSYDCSGCVIPLESAAGWEAAFFDHFQAMVTALCTKLALGVTQTSKTDFVGGSTYGFDVWQGHPHRAEVLGFLRATRERAVALREKVADYNVEHPAEGELERVIAYVGQTVVGLADNEDGEMK